MIRIKLKLIILILIVSFFGCSKDSTSSPNTCDTMICSKPSEEPDLCLNDWYAQNDLITVIGFGRFLPVEYIVDGNKMTTNNIEEYTVNDSSWTQYSFSEYTNQ